MHVTRKTNQELVVVDSSIWVSVFLLCSGAATAYASMTHGKPNGLWIVAFFGLCAFLFWRKEVVVFDAARQQALWWRRRAFKSASATVPFSEIKGIGMEASAAGEHGTLTYRLTILTADKPVPMSDAYAGDRGHYDALKAEICEFLHIDSGEASTSSVGDENFDSVIAEAGTEDRCDPIGACKPENRPHRGSGSGERDRREDEGREVTMRYDGEQIQAANDGSSMLLGDNE
jgi:hypothetical protein